MYLRGKAHRAHVVFIIAPVRFDWKEERPLELIGPIVIEPKHFLISPPSLWQQTKTQFHQFGCPRVLEKCMSSPLPLHFYLFAFFVPFFPLPPA